MKTTFMNKKKYISTKGKQAMSVLALFFFLFGSVSCSPDTREGDQEAAEEVNTELESTEWEAREGQSEWEDKNNENVSYTPGEQFEELDADRDQRMTYQEFEAETEEENYFNRWDADNDRSFSERELNEGLFNNWDKNQDNFLDGSEYQAYNSAWRDRYGDNFSTWDSNQDEQLDIDEFDAGVRETGTYGAWDTNNDGVISREEFRRARFDTRDADQDGSLSSEEYEELEYNIWGLGEE